MLFHVIIETTIGRYYFYHHFIREKQNTERSGHFSKVRKLKVAKKGFGYQLSSFKISYTGNHSENGCKHFNLAINIGFQSLEVKTSYIQELSSPLLGINIEHFIGRITLLACEMSAGHS